MLRNYFKIGLRNLISNRVYSIINIAGLAMGIGVVTLLFSLINFELSHDIFHQKSDRIYRIVRKVTYDSGNVEYTSGTSLAVIDALKQDIPQFEKIVPLCGTIEPQITVLGKDKNSANNSIKYNEEKQGICAGPEFFYFRWTIYSMVLEVF